MESASGGTVAPDPNSGEPSPSAAAAAGASSASERQAEGSSQAPPSRYESQKRRDWNTFLQYLKNHKPPLTLARCSGAHVIEFLKYLDQFGKTKVHILDCPYFGDPNPPAPCACPLKQAWGSLDALIGRLRAAYEENGGRQESNPFGARAVRIYLREVKEGQAKARGVPYEKKKRKRSAATTAEAVQAKVSVSDSQGVETVGGSSKGGGVGDGGGNGIGNSGGETTSTTPASAAATTTAV